MAYAEKRAKGPQSWRVKYKPPDGTEASESSFDTKAAALAWVRDQEALIRAGRWTDPNAGKITVSRWIDRWLAIRTKAAAPAGDQDQPEPASRAEPAPEPPDEDAPLAKVIPMKIFDPFAEADKRW
jgi:hypothetical protein